MRDPSQVSPEDLYYAGVEALAEGHYEEAIARYREALQLDPGFLDALHGLAQACVHAERWDEGIHAAQELIRMAPDDPLGRTSLSILYQRKGMIPEAEEESRAAKLLAWKQELRGPTEG